MFNHVDGSVIGLSDGSNAASYGRSRRPTDIIAKRSVGNSTSAGLRNAAAKLRQYQHTIRLILSDEGLRRLIV